MKKYTNILIIILFLGVIAGFMGFNGEENSAYTSENMTTNISKIIQSEKSVSIFQPVNIFNLAAQNSNAPVMKDFVNKGVMLNLNSQNLKNVLSAGDKNIEFNIPMDNAASMTLELTRAYVTTKDFEMVDLSTGRETKIKDEGLYYRGIIKGDNTSLATISIFKNFVMGVISNKDGNFVLGSVKDAQGKYTDNYIFYNDKDIRNQKPFVCGDEGIEDRMVKNFSKTVSLNHSSEDNFVSPDTVDVYYVTDYQMYLDAQSDTVALYSFVNGFFNSVAAIYGNEGIPFKISRIDYYSSTDPYASSNDSYDILLKFGDHTRDNFRGDLAQLLSTGHNGQLGGIAWINVLCTPATFDQSVNGYVGRFSFANIEPTYTPYPTYSWTVTVTTHEMGHNMGSYHTHACHWKTPGGGIGPLDTCIVTEENSAFSGNGGCINAQPDFNCYRPNSILTSGFVMSYCHFCQNQGGGINLANGFGRPFNSIRSQSGDTIRMWFAAASCLHSNVNSSENPVTYNLLQNYPNPFNPTTNIKFALPDNGFVTLRIFDVTGREVAVLLNSKFYEKGVFNYTLDASYYKMASGVYFYRLDVNNDNKNIYTQIKKMVLVK